MIEKNEKILVPYGIRYLSDWKEFNFNNFPGKCIINKQLPGCGFTEFCIRSCDNLILCSPRKRLIKNKFDQHKEDVFLVIRDNDSDPNVDKDISIDIKINDKAEKKIEENIINTEKEISDFLTKLRNCINETDLFNNLENNSYKKLYIDFTNYLGKMNLLNRPYKILVTYDSYRLVREILIHFGIFESFKTVVDEFQSILHDARFKSNTELGFLEYLKQSPTTYFVSATPMLDEYLDMLEEFDGLPYFELDWKTLDPGRIIKPDLNVLTMKSVGTKAGEVIQKYLDGDFEKVVIQDKDTGELKEVVSDEAVLFVNSVNHIISIIKKMELTPDQVTILCSDTEANKKKIQRKLGKIYLQCLSDIPLKGVKPKMFTFCTSTTYLGADFYSLCARTFIFSDSNLDCLAVDISDDLPQILGRQRLDENPWKNSATFYYKTTADWKSKTEDDFNKVIETKKRKSGELLSLYKNIDDSSTANTFAETCESAVKADSYKKNYVAVNRVRLGNNKFELIPVFNNLVYVNEIRAFRIAQIDYKDRFSVFSEIREKFGSRFTGREDESLIIEFLDLYDNASTMRDKYRLLCESELPVYTLNYILDQIPNSDVVKSDYLALGPEKLRATGYNRTFIDKALGKIVFNRDNLKYEMLYTFNIGDTFSLSQIKLMMTGIYKKVGYTKAPVASDILNYFEVKESSLRRDLDGSGIKKRVVFYKILSVKPEFENDYNLIKGIINQEDN